MSAPLLTPQSVLDLEATLSRSGEMMKDLSRFSEDLPLDYVRACVGTAVNKKGGNFLFRQVRRPDFGRVGAVVIVCETEQ